MLVIRLARIGRGHRAAFRIVVQEKTKAPKSDALDMVGTYDPLAKGENWKFEVEKIKAYLAKGAQASATVHNALLKAGVIEGKKQKVVGSKKGVLAKAKADVETASKAAAEAKKAAAEKPIEAPAPEAPVETPPVAETPTPPTEQK